MVVIPGKYSTATIMIDNVEESAMGQIVSFVNHPAFTNPISIMSDVHAGKGAVIGFTMRMTEMIVPNVIGVDIGCGIASVNLGPKLGMDFEHLDHKIRQRIPFGKNTHDKAVIHMKNSFPWRRVNTLAQKFALAFGVAFGKRFEPVDFTIDWFMEKIAAIGGDTRRIINSVGTLGGGNHFIEVGLSTAGDHWVTVHSGSRNFGKRVCEYWQGVAGKKAERMGKDERKKLIADLKRQFTGEELYRRIKAVKDMPDEPAGQFHCPDDQRWLEGEDAQGYLMDMLFSQVYAQVNREYILKTIMDILAAEPRDTIETVHNFIDFQDFIIRKGAIRSYAGERMLIPFNMRDGILVCTGKSNPAWNCSAPHGAGRALSRSQAKKQIDLATFRRQMKGVYSTSVGAGTLDEAPDAYKDSKLIEAAIGPTAQIVERIRPLHNMKDSLGMDD
jgi:tRNA-splicing ligase RtcB